MCQLVGHAVDRVFRGIFFSLIVDYPLKGAPVSSFFGFAGLRVLLIEHYLKNKEVVYLLVKISNSKDACYST